MKRKILTTFLGFGVALTGMSLLTACHTVQGTVEGVGQDVRAVTTPAPMPMAEAPVSHKHMMMKKHHRKHMTKKGHKKMMKKDSTMDQTTSTTTSTTSDGTQQSTTTDTTTSTQ